MAGKNTAAFGIYPNEVTLRNGVETLQREGFRSTDISVLFPAIGMLPRRLLSPQS